jgi:hypothetical protein
MCTVPERADSARVLRAAALAANAVTYVTSTPLHALSLKPGVKRPPSSQQPPAVAADGSQADTGLQGILPRPSKVPR